MKRNVGKYQSVYFRLGHQTMLKPFEVTLIFWRVVLHQGTESLLLLRYNSWKMKMYIICFIVTRSRLSGTSELSYFTPSATHNFPNWSYQTSTDSKHLGILCSTYHIKHMIKTSPCVTINIWKYLYFLTLILILTFKKIHINKNKIITYLSQSVACSS